MHGGVTKSPSRVKSEERPSACVREQAGLTVRTRRRGDHEHSLSDEPYFQRIDVPATGLLISDCDR